MVRVDPISGRQTVEVEGLTTAVDVATDEAGNLYVLELTTVWPSTRLPQGFDLFRQDAPPDPGGYQRYTGRLRMYPPQGRPLKLAEGLDAPTNLTYADGAVYLSTGQGTPGRLVLGPDGVRPIAGELYRLQVPKVSSEQMGP